MRLARSTGQVAVRAGNRRGAVWARGDLATSGGGAGDVAFAKAFHHAARDMIAKNRATGPDPDPAAIHRLAGVVAVGAAKRPAGNRVVAVDDAVVAAVRGAVVHAVAFQAATVAAHATAVNHVVTRKIAAVAIGAALVAIRARAAFAQGSAHAAARTGMAARHAQREGGANQAGYDKATSAHSGHPKAKPGKSSARVAMGLAAVFFDGSPEEKVTRGPDRP